MKYKIISVLKGTSSPNLLTEVEKKLKNNNITTQRVKSQGFETLYVSIKHKEKAEKLASPIMLARFR